MGAFTTGSGEFLLNGEPFKILAGGIHYFRCIPEYWEDRLRKLKAMGLNTVETYIAWNLHEPQPGNYRFDGELDLATFVTTAHDLGLYVILRPGPYICSERDLGGLPSWLLKDPDMRLRCMYGPYIEAVDRYFDELFDRLVELQFSRGGPVIAMQVENEYGSYGNDAAYIRYLRDGMQARGMDVLYFSADGPSDTMLQGGSLPDLLKTVNFGSNSAEAFAKLREYQPEQPLMCTEYWLGWFDHWGEEHHVRSAEEAAAELDEVLGAGSAILYMLYGGTNFGFFNGANHNQPAWEERNGYQPTITSYDFDAPVSEAGDITPKFHAFREVLSKYTEIPYVPLPEPAPKLALGQVRLPESIGLWDALAALSSPVDSTVPLPMEMLDQDYGFILYRTTISGPREEGELTLRNVADRAQIFLDGNHLGVLDRMHSKEKIKFAVPPEGATLEILVENMGRVNYGVEMHDHKGITEGVVFWNQFLYHWTIWPLPLADLGGLSFADSSETGGPRFFRGSFTVDEALDTFLALPGWTKGACWVNGFNLGRYWEIGPQKTLYVPGPRLKQGINELIIFELHGCKAPAVEFRDAPDIG